MAGKRRISKSKSSKGKKKKKKSNKNDDWYNDDINLNVLNATKKVHKRGPKGESKSKPGFTLFNPSKSDHPENGRSLHADLDNNDSSGEDSDYEVEDPYNSLISSIISSGTGFDKKHQDVLHRVRREEEGIESEDDEDDSNSDTDGSEGAQNHVDLPESNGKENASDGVTTRSATSQLASHDKQDEKNEEQSDDDDDDDDGLEGSVYDSRFVKTYNLSETKISTLTSPEYISKNKIVSKSTLSDGSNVTKHSFAATITTYGVDVIGLQSGTWQQSKSIKDEDLAMAQKFQLKQRLVRRWKEYTGKRSATEKSRGYSVRRNVFKLTPLQHDLLQYLSKYQDVCFMGQTLHNAAHIREATVVHILNHVFKSKDILHRHSMKIKNHEIKMKKAQQEAKVSKELGVSNTKEPKITEIGKDQGFTRPRVLVILPTKASALRFMKVLFELLPAGTQISNKKRFMQEFSVEVSETPTEVEMRQFNRDQLDASISYDESDLANETHPILKDDKLRFKGAVTRPADWHERFDGNSEECFRLGVSFGGRKSLTLFSEFYNSDIILASPLGLRLATGQDIGDDMDDDTSDTLDESDEEDTALKELGYQGKRKQGNNRDEGMKNKIQRKKVDIDFLSSIELCMVYQADFIKMQNWQHLVDVMKVINRKPLKMRTDTDFARVRDYFLDGKAASFRQTVVISQFPDAFIQSIFTRRSAPELNIAGQVIIRPKTYEGMLLDVIPAIPQRFLRVGFREKENKAEVTDADCRFLYFVEKILPALKSEDALGTVLVVPSYFDFVRVRNLFTDVASDLERIYDSSKRSKNRARGRDGKRISNTQKKLENNLGIEAPAIFASLSEYTPPDVVSRIRGDFFRRNISVLIVTERFHYYFRYRLRGIKRVIFYAPPLHSRFYAEFLNFIPNNEDGDSISNTVYTARDALALERIVGTEHARNMIKSSSMNSYTFSFEN